LLVLLFFKKPYWDDHFWYRGYFVNTVGLNEEMIRHYVQYQEDQDKKEEAKSQNFTLFDSLYYISKTPFEGYAFILLPNPPPLRVVV